MIDAENEIFTEIFTALRDKYGDSIYITGTPITKIPAVLPAVGIMEINNTEPASTRDSSGVEKYSDLLYQVTIYSNNSSGKISQCKEILSIIDPLLRSKNFLRESNVPETPINDGKTYWKTVRYSVRTDGKHFYRT